MKTLFDETTLSGLKMKNRFIRSGLYTGLAGERGRLTPEIFEVYEELAKGGVSTIITGYCYIKEDDQANVGMAGLYDDAGVADFNKFTEMIHGYGANIILQMACGGSLTYVDPTGRDIVGPSAVENQTTKITPRPMTRDDIRELAAVYAQAAVRARQAGFDGVEVHAAHGYLLSQFLCPYLNRRTDEYGGSAENRGRILFEIYAAIRQAVGDDFPVFFKINSADYMENGLTEEDSLIIAEKLCKLGVDAIDVSGGNESITESIENNRTTARKGVAASITRESYFKDYAAALAKRVDTPVILVGGNRHPDLMEDLLGDTDIAYFSLGRPLTSEPDLINRWAAGDLRKTRCVSCNQCYTTPGKRCHLNIRKASKHQNAGKRVPIEPDNPSIVVDPSKCVQCGRCKRLCHGLTTVHSLYDLKKTGDVAMCVNCGQCANVCPTGAIRERYDYEKIELALRDPEKVVVFSTSPAVRVALGEPFGARPGTNVEGKMVAALKALGADYVFDETFSADLTICEEASELIDRVKNGRTLPQFTSCCPSWVKYAETFYPEFIPNLSTAKSPISMQGAVIKTYFASQRGIDPSKIVSVAVAPCTAKKFEITRPELNDAGKAKGQLEIRDNDYVITTRELARWIEERKIDFDGLEEASFDDLLARGTGAGVIFGNTGGVMEAAARTAYTYLTGEKPPEVLYELTPVRGMQGIKEAELEIGGVKLKLAVAYGLNHARQILEGLKDGSLSYDFVEIMNCIGGCIGGGGQPKNPGMPNKEIRERRIRGLYREDDALEKRLSHENPEIITLYGEWLGEPLSETAEKLLHTMYDDKSGMLAGIGIK